MYFCSEDAAKFAGEGAKAHESYRKANHNKPPALTPFDRASVMTELKKAGVAVYAKVIANKSNEELFKKYGAGLNTLVVCAPSGEALIVLAGSQCNQSGVSAALKGLGAQMAALRKNAKDHSGSFATR